MNQETPTTTPTQTPATPPPVAKFDMAATLESVLGALKLNLSKFPESAKTSRNYQNTVKLIVRCRLLLDRVREDATAQDALLLAPSVERQAIPKPFDPIACAEEVVGMLRANLARYDPAAKTSRAYTRSLKNLVFCEDILESLREGSQR